MSCEFADRMRCGVFLFLIVARRFYAARSANFLCTDSIGRITYMRLACQNAEMSRTVCSRERRGIQPVWLAKRRLSET